jgi:hypothetical protein
MLIKAPNATGALKISDLHTELTDLPATVSDLLKLNEKFEGRSMFDGDASEVRERRFYTYNTKAQNYESFLTYLDEFIISGSVFDKASWRAGSTYRSPAEMYYASEINFGTRDSHPHLLRGWSEDQTSNEGYTYNWAVGNSASVLIVLAKDESVALTANVRPAQFDEPQIVTVKVEGEVVGSWELGIPWNLAEHSVVIEPDKNRPDVSVVDFEFSQQLGPEEYRKAVAFESIKLRSPDE